MALAETANGHPGIAAGLKVELPNQFVWQLYRAVLGDDIPTSLPYDKMNLSWRLLGMLPQLTDAVYQPLQRYLQDDSDGRKSYQLALRLADLFDQYQVYRGVCCKARWPAWWGSWHFPAVLTCTVRHCRRCNRVSWRGQTYCPIASWYSGYRRCHNKR
jgi:exonuclease V gamma subunit